MSDPFFRQTVFPDELADVRARREAVGLPTEHLTDVPSVDNELVGLAISGGGVRSASFALGVVQVLVRRGLLKRVDYLSTVSGGGFLGGSLSALLHNETAGATDAAFPLGHPPGRAESPALAHVRSHAAYLAPDGTLDRLRIPTLLVSGVLVNTAIWLPVLLLAAAATDLAHHLLQFAYFSRMLLALAGAGFLLFAGMAVTRPAVAQVFGRRLDWRSRNTATRVLAFSFFMAWGLLGVIPLLLAALAAVNADVGAWLEPEAILSLSDAQVTVTADPGLVTFIRLIVLPIKTELLVGLFLATAGLGFAAYRFTLAFWEPLKSLALRTVGLVGPGILYVSYLVICVFAVGYGEAPDEGASLYQKLLFREGVPEPFHLLGLTGAVLGVLVMVFYNVNLTSLHRFYRDRLSRAWLISHTGDDGRTHAPQHVDALRLTQLAAPGSPAPYHLIQAAANTSEQDPRLHGRAADFFEFSKRWVGGAITGWCPTPVMERLDPYLDVGTAMAVSGAAAAPQMGTETIRPLAFLMAMLNVRMGYWIPHPERSRHASGLRRLLIRLGPGPAYMLREALGSLSLEMPFVYLSDGGHIENLGAYALIRRRCRFVIAVDGEEDPHLHCTSLMELIRFARMDEGIEIEIDVSELQRDAIGHSKRGFAIGTIHYSDESKGTLFYLKSSITGSEAQDLLDYRRRFPAFPHDSTADQFFDPARFEAYRALGHHVATAALANQPGDPSEVGWLPGQSSAP